MSFYEDYQKNEEDFYSEMDSSLFKVSAPIGRMKFFINFICLIILSAIVTFAGIMLSFFGPIAILIAFLLIIYIEFVINASRLWDIIGEQKPAIIFSILTILLNFIGVGLIISIVLCLIPGKLIK